MGDLIKMTLGFDSEHFEYADLVEYFKTEREETNNLEFKSFDQRENVKNNTSILFESVCAFLNSEGGVIIWGAPQPVTRDSIKYCVGNLMPINQTVDSDDVYRRISSNITPIPNGINIKKLTSGSNSLLVIEIQKSEYRPHQLNKKSVYYMRVAGTNIPAPHHYVEALMKRITYPDVRAKIKFDSIQYKSQHLREGLPDIPIRIDLTITQSNSSPFQNEEFPWLSISTSIGEPFIYWPSWPELDKPLIGASRKETMEILHFGQNRIWSLSIGLYKSDLIQHNSALRVFIQFGGRFSPLKYSVYEIDLSNFDSMKEGINMLHNIDVKDITAHENKHPFEILDKLEALRGLDGLRL